jgi:hypothetical protein
MSTYNYQIIYTGDQQVDRVQTNIQNAFNNITGPFIGGILLTGVSVANAATPIQHGLGRTPQLWVLCDQNTLTTVKRISWDSNVITLEAGADCVISLWVN